MTLGGVEIDANGHEYVDLGLPSGTLWATCNVGATSPEKKGNYYYFADGSTNALSLMGGDWVLPTWTQLAELIKGCTCDFTYSISGVSGLLLTSNTNGNTLFFPEVTSGIAPGQSGVSTSGWYILIPEIKTGKSYCALQRDISQSGISSLVVGGIYRYSTLPTRAVITRS